MSRIGKMPITLPKGVEVKVDGGFVVVKGPKGALKQAMHPSMGLKIEGGVVTVAPQQESSRVKRFHGLARTMISNMIGGVTTGYKKSLTLVGVGYRAAVQGKGVTLSLGYSHPIEFVPPAGIEVKVTKQTELEVHGMDKQLVGEVAAQIRRFRAPEPYHGKGVRYTDEVIVTKVGKSAGKK